MHAKTIICNILSPLVESSIARVINIEDDKTSYDIITENHVALKCEFSGTIYNFSVDIDSLTSEDLKNFKINDKKVYFKGICLIYLSGINEIK